MTSLDQITAASLMHPSSRVCGLGSGYLAAHHGPINFFEDLHKASRKDPESWMLSTEYNFVVSYRAKERCEQTQERKRVDKVLVHAPMHHLDSSRT